MIPVSTCAVCGADDLRPYAFSRWRPGTLHFAQARCAACGLVMAQPRASSGEIARYYEERYYREHAPDPERNVAENAAHYRRLEYPLLRTLWRDWPPTPGGLVIEVGCGYGAFLPLMQGEGYRVAGCDLSHDAVRYCRSQGLDVVQGGVPGTTFGERATLVISQHVIEHVEDPRTFVKALAALAAPGGLIALVTEDSWSAQGGWARLRARLRGAMPEFSTSTDHTFLFAATHLRRLLTEAGCDAVRTRSYCSKGGGESLHWRLYKMTMRGVNRIAGRGDYLVAVGRLSAPRGE